MTAPRRNPESRSSRSSARVATSSATGSSRLLLLVQDLHVAAAVFAGFGFDRAGSAGDLLVGDALGRAAQHAFDAQIIPQRAAKRTGAKARAMGAAPADDQGRDRRRCRRPDRRPRPTGTSAGASSRAASRAKCTCSAAATIHMLGQRVAGIAFDSTARAIASRAAASARFDPRQAPPRACPASRSSLASDSSRSTSHRRPRRA